MTYTKQSFLYAVLFHGLILLAMFLYRFPINIPMPTLDYYVEFVTPEIVPLQQDRQIASQSGGEQSEQNQAITPPAKRLDIPEVTTIDDDEDNYFANLPDKIDSSDRFGNLLQTSNQTDLQATQNNISQTNSGNNTNISGNSSLGLSGLGETIKSETGTSSVSDIQGDARNRTIISKPLPTFPSNINRNGSVTMEFTVEPDGSVSNVILTHMSEIEFNTASLNALRQWLFNPADRSHTGRITFNFRLE